MIMEAVSKRCFKSVSRVLKEYFKGCIKFISRVSEGILKVVLKMFLREVQGYSMLSMLSKHAGVIPT